MAKQPPKTGAEAPKPTPAATQEAQKPAENQPAAGGNSQTLPEQLPTATDTVKVKFLRSHPALAYSPGEVADLPRELYDKYLEAGPFYEAVVEESAD